MRQSKVFFRWALILIALSFSLMACGSPKTEYEGKESTEGEVVEKNIRLEKALDFTLNDLDGNSVSLRDFFGREALLLDFTTTWCPHCITIIPAIKDIHSRYKDKGLKVIAVYINESKAKVEKFAAKHGIPYTVLLDTDGSIASKYEVRGVPTIIVVDRDGMIGYKGHQVSTEMIEEAIRG